MSVWTCLITNSDKNTKKSMKKDFSFKSSSASVQVRRNTHVALEVWYGEIRWDMMVLIG